MASWSINRREGLALLAGGVAASVIPARAAGKLEVTSLEIGANRDPQLGAQFVVAVTKNLFKEEGLDVNVRWTQVAGDMQPLFAGGTLQIGTLGLHSVIPLRTRGVPLRAVCALCEYSGSQGLVLRQNVKLSSPAELVGKRIAVPNEAPHEMALPKLGQKYGFDASKVILVRMAPPETVAAFGRGDVDGALTFQPQLYNLLKLGGHLYFTGTATYFNGTKVDLALDDWLLYIHAVLAVNENWVKSHPNTTAAVIRALLKANSMLLNQQAEAQKIMQDFFHADAEALHQAMGQNIYGLAIDASVKKSVQFSNDWLAKIHKIPGPVKPADTVYATILKGIDPKLVSWDPA